MASIEDRILTILFEAKDQSEDGKGWVTRDQIAAELGHKNNELNFNAREKLEDLFVGGKVAKRLQPETGRTTYEYRFIGSLKKRSRKEVILSILREYFDGEWVSEADIADALHLEGNTLSGKDHNHFYKLQDDGRIEERTDPANGVIQYRFVQR